MTNKTDKDLTEEILELLKARAGETEKAKKTKSETEVQSGLFPWEFLLVGIAIFGIWAWNDYRNFQHDRQLQQIHQNQE